MGQDVRSLALSRKDAAKVLLKAYRDKLAFFGKFPGDKHQMDPLLEVKLRISEWEAIYAAFKGMLEE